MCVLSVCVYVSVCVSTCVCSAGVRVGGLLRKQVMNYANTFFLRGKIRAQGEKYLNITSVENNTATIILSDLKYKETWMYLRPRCSTDQKSGLRSTPTR